MKDVKIFGGVLFLISGFYVMLQKFEFSSLVGLVLIGAGFYLILTDLK